MWRLLLRLVLRGGAPDVVSVALVAAGVAIVARLLIGHVEELRAARCLLLR